MYSFEIFGVVAAVIRFVTLIHDAHDALMMVFHHYCTHRPNRYRSGSSLGRTVASRVILWIF